MTENALRLSDLAEAHVAVWGYGREGQAALKVLGTKFPGKHVVLF